MAWGPDGVIVKDSELLSEKVTATVAEISESTTLHGGSIKVKIHDKAKALELLGRHLGMWKDNNKNEHSFLGPDGEPVTVVIKTIYVTPGAQLKRVTYFHRGRISGQSAPRSTTYSFFLGFQQNS